MPGLVILKRRWKVGSDDLVFPAINETVIRLIWLIVLLVVWASDGPDLSCSEGELIKVYYCMSSITSGVTVIITVFLIRKSMKGTIMNVSPRRDVPLLVYLRIGLAIPDVVFTILGTIWAFTLDGHCLEEAGSSLPVMKGFSICNWIMLVIVMFGVAMVFDPSGRLHTTTQLYSGPAAMEQRQSRIWELRCKIMCCFWCSGPGRTRPAKKEAFRDIAALLSSFFKDVDLVPSDIFTGLILLNRRYNLRKDAERQSYSIVNHNARLGSNDPLDFDIHSTAHPSIRSDLDYQPLSSTVIDCSYGETQEWMNPLLANWYFKYAKGIYGWMLEAYSGIKSGKCDMNFSCGCCRRQSLSYEVQDNCCRSNLASLKRVTDVSDDDLIYVSFHNKLFEVPFSISADHSTQAVVIAIRGSLSFHDALTDLTAKPEPVSAEGLPEGCIAHKGILHAATFVYKQLEEKRLIEQALDRFPGYKLVVVGHSLGAGTAALLSILLISKYPYLRCFAYSPPGGLLNEPAARYTESFTMSVVTGDDVVPRLSLKNLELLKRQLISELHACQDPKYRVLMGGCLSAVFGKSPNSSRNTARNSETIEVSLNVDITTDPTEPLLYLPGRILHIIPRQTDHETETEGFSKYDWRWKHRRDFGEILVTRSMLSHHLPTYVGQALSKLAEQVAQQEAIA